MSRGGIIRDRDVTPVDRESVSWANTVAMLREPRILLCGLYAVAICFEQLVEIEVFKPYRLIGLLLLLYVVKNGRWLFDRLAKLSVSFIAAGFLLAVFQTALGIGNYVSLFSVAVQWAFNVATFIAIASMLRSKREIVLIALIHAVALVVAAYGISAEAAGDALLEGTPAARLTGDFRNPANACMSMLFACLIFFTAARRRYAGAELTTRVMVAVTVAAVALYMLYTSTLTGSRAGAGLLLAGLALYLALTSMRQMLIAIPVMLAAALVLFSLSSADMDFRDTNVLALRMEKKGLDTDRLFLWRAGLDAYTSTGGVGLGMGRYPYVHKEYFAPYAYRSDPRWMDSDLTLHNDYVSALVEFGLIGFILFVLLCHELWRMSRSIPDRDIRAIAIAVLVGIAINGLTHTGLPYFAVWFMFALLSAWVNAEREGRRQRVWHQA